MRMGRMWRIELFGGLRVQSEGQVTTRFRTEKTGSLLAFLAFHRDREHAREILTDLFWPDVDLASGRHSLRLALSSLRRQFAPTESDRQLLLADRQTVRLDPSLVACDVQEFEETFRTLSRARDADERIALLRRAVDLHSAELLLGLYDSWIVPHRLQLQERALSAALELSRLLEARQEHDLAADYVSRAVALDPLCEEAQVARLRLTIAAGRYATAARQVREIEALWWEHLNEPVPEAVRALAKSHPLQPVNLRSLSAARPAVSAGKPAPAFGVTSPAADMPDRARSTFVGRQEELQALAALLDPAGAAAGRIVTLTGPGGSGKTRLAQEVAGRLSAVFEGAVWFVDLSGLADPSRLPRAVQEGMRLRGVKDVPPLEAVIETLRARPCLLILDNLEQLLPDGSAFVEMLCREAPTLTCLVTSRRRLDTPGEQEFPVLPLPVPAGTEAPAHLRRIPSVALFLARAEHSRPDFHLDPTSAREVAEICSRLEGLPLAIELAAAQVYRLATAHILAGLGSRYELLVGRDRNQATRHRSLRSAVAWSYDLLSPRAQRLFQRLSIFRGGWATEAARVVCEEIEANQVLDELNAGSLVSVDLREDGHWRMLETLREFSAQQLPPGECDGLAHRHLEFYRGLAEEAGSKLTGPDQQEWVRRLTADQENLRAALETAAEREPVAGVRLAGALWRFWLMQGELSEGRERIERLLALAPDAPLSIRANALYGAGVLAAEQSDYAAARRCFEARLALVQEMGDEAGIAATLNALGNVAREGGDYPAARRAFEESLRIRKGLDDSAGVAATTLNLSNLLHDQGAFEEAIEAAREGLALMRRNGNQTGEASALESLGIALRACARYEEAIGFHEQSLALWSALGNRHAAVGALHNLAASLYHVGLLDRAQQAVEEALDVNRQLGHRAWVAFNLNLLAGITLKQGRAEAALSHAREALQIRQALGGTRSLCASLSRLALIAESSDDAARAVRLFAAAEALRSTAGVRQPQDEASECEAALDALRRRMDLDTFAQAWEAGARLTLDEAVAEALHTS
jgi:predicted ATPase/DNA-binding SARP family transcriptional activator